jgi:hypothetical protein
VKTFRDGRYEQVVQLLRPVRHVAHRFGGSHAQRDVIERTLIEAARRAGMTRLFEALGHERASAKAYPAHRAASAAGHLNFKGEQA